MVRALWLLWALILLAGCSRPVVAPATQPAGAGEPDAVRIESLTALLHDRPTHLACGSSGTFYVQESPEGWDHVEQLNELNSPRETGLTTAAIVAALSLPSATGNIQAITGGDAGIYFYFCGYDHQNLIACVGRFNVADAKIQIIADTKHLSELSGLGDALSISRAEMTQVGNTVWLMLHSLDGSVFLQIDATAPATGSSTGPADSTDIKRDFDKYVFDFLKPDLTHDDYSIGAGPEGSVLVLDRWLNCVWKISTDGHAVLATPLTGLPHDLSAPTLNENGQVVMFAASSAKLLPRENSPPTAKMPLIDYPALLLGRESEIAGFGESTLLGDPGFSVDKTHLTALVPSGDHKAWMAYDPGQGELFRLLLIERK